MVCVYCQVLIAPKLGRTILNGQLAHIESELHPSNRANNLRVLGMRACTKAIVD
jgi:hypothetical protein